MQHADDINDILQDKLFARHFRDIVQEYVLYSCLLLNTTQTEGICLGKYRYNTPKPLNILWPNRPLRILGLYTFYDEEACYKLSFESLLNKAGYLTNLCWMRNLTLYGRAKIIKTFMSSQFLFVALVIATPQKVYNLLNSLVFKFFWKSKSESQNRKVWIQDYERGGLIVADFKTLVKIAQMKWITEMKGNHTYYWKSILKSY